MVIGDLEKDALLGASNMDHDDVAGTLQVFARGAAMSLEPQEYTV